MIQDIRYLNNAIKEFHEKFDKLFNDHWQNGPDTKEVASLLTEYHLIIAPYIAENEKGLFEVLNLWSSGKVENGWGRNIVELLTQQENGLALGYLWGLGLEPKIASLFTEELLESEEYDANLLPPALMPYKKDEGDSEIRIS